MQCVESAGAGAGASGDGKWMIAGGLGKGLMLEPAGQRSVSLFESETH